MSPHFVSSHGLSLVAQSNFEFVADGTDALNRKFRTVEPRLSGPRLSGFLDYPDFFSGPNLVMNIY